MHTFRRPTWLQSPDRVPMSRGMHCSMPRRPSTGILTIVACLGVLVLCWQSYLSFLSPGDHQSSLLDHDSWISFAKVQPHEKQPTKAIIATVMRTTENSTDWIVDLLPDWEPHVFMADAKIEDAKMLLQQHVKKVPAAYNRGREASTYLSYIINNYYNLPDYMVFVHGERYQRHNDDPMYDTLPTIKNLDLDYVNLEGYANLRCNWKDCPRPYIIPDLGHEDSPMEAHGTYAEAWVEFFPDERLPEKVGAPCCAQFAVNRATVHRWPVAKYEQIRRWLWSQNHGYKNYLSGIVLEYMWHVIFGKPAYWCPSARDCYCGTWNQCDLECDDEAGWCEGRIWLRDPPNVMPTNWPEEGQDGVDWPIEGWEKNFTKKVPSSSSAEQM